MIRKFRQEDEDAIIRVWLEASSVGHHFIPLAYWESLVKDVRDIYLPQNETYVDTDDTTGNIAGFLTLSGDYIAGIFVAPDYHGQGIGQALMAHAKNLRTRLELKVYQENTRAFSFYLRQGFKISCEQTDEDTGHKEYVMVYQAALSI